MSPVNFLQKGMVKREDGDYFSASALAAANIKGMPNSRAGVYKKADREGWPSINVPGKGALDGVKYFKLPDALVEQLEVAIGEHSFGQDLEGIELKNRRVEQKTLSYDHDMTDQDFVYIDAYPEVRAASGAGQMASTEQVVLKIAMNIKDYRDYIGVSFKNIKMITNYGDSNTPTINHGDQVMVDISCNKFIDDAFYVFLQADNLRIKRIKLRLDGSIEVKSDNVKDFMPEIYKPDEAAEFNIVGRVIPFKFGKFTL